MTLILGDKLIHFYDGILVKKGSDIYAFTTKYRHEDLFLLH